MPAPPPLHLDELDRRILDVVQEDALLTSEELAARVNSSAPTCLRRLRRLRSSGVIAREVALLDPARLGRSLVVFVHVVLERQNQKQQDAFERRMDALAEVTQCYMTSGDVDFVLVVNVPDMHAYMEFVSQALTRDENVKNFRSLFSMRRSKFRTSLVLG